MLFFSFVHGWFFLVKSVAAALFVAATFFSCSTGRVGVADVIGENVPEETIRPCLVSDPDSSVDCFDYLLHEARWKNVERNASPDESFDSILKAFYPGFYLRPADMQAIRRTLIFLLPKLHTAALNHGLSEYDIARLLDESLPVFEDI